MNNIPPLSVILTSYNHEKYIKETIDSILGQTFKDFELIILDDNSSDKSWQIIQSYDDSRIVAFQTEKQNSIVEAINKTIKEIAKGEYIAIHHSDDVWELTKLEKQVKFLDENSEYGAVFTHVKIIDEYNKVISNNWFNVSSNYDQFCFLNDAFNGYNKLCHPSILIRKKVYDEIGYYKYGLAQTGDMEMWSRLTLYSNIFVLPEKLTFHRKFTNNSNTSGIRPDVVIRTKNEFLYILDNFLNIQDFEFLSKIFPEIKLFATKDKFVSEYCLSMMALKSINEVTKIFAIKLLYKLLNHEEKALKAKTFYNFDYNKMISISSDFNFINSGMLIETKEQELSQTKQDLETKEQELSQTKQDLETKEQELSQTKQKLENIKTELANIYISKSWKLTRPLRRFMRIVKK